MKTLPSVASHLECRVESLQLDAGVVIGEMPVDAGFRVVPVLLPSRRFRLHLVQCVDSPI